MQKKEEVKESKRTQGKKSSDKLNEMLIENFVNLQKTMTNLTIKFDNMADQMSKLLQLFEISARSFAEKLATGAPDLEKDREFLDKLNALLEQNKTIAKGLTLMEEKLKQRLYGYGNIAPPMQPRRQIPSQMQPSASVSQGYLPSTTENSKEQQTRKPLLPY